MRLLGKCPNCGREDTIFQFWKEIGNFDDREKVKCSYCGTIWHEWFHLMYEEEKKGNRLIPMEIERRRGRDNGQEYGVQLVAPSRQYIPWCDMIISTLNTALIIRFSDPNADSTSRCSREVNKLDVCIVTEGGIRGFYKGDYIKLINIDDHLGLHVEYDYCHGEGMKQVLNFYQIMLKYLFEVGPESVGGRYRRGEILRLSKDKKDFARAWQILATMLIYVKNKDFAEKVAKRIKGIQKNPFVTYYLK